MKITAFNPMIITPKADEAIEVFEALGFERRHQKDGINDKDITSVDLKNADGFRIDVTRVDHLPQAMTSIRMTVSDFDEAYKLFESLGFKNAQGGIITDTGSSKATMMVSPSGFTISLSQHIKDEDK